MIINRLMKGRNLATENISSGEYIIYLNLNNFKLYREKAEEICILLEDLIWVIYRGSGRQTSSYLRNFKSLNIYFRDKASGGLVIINRDNVNYHKEFVKDFILRIGGELHLESRKDLELLFIDYELLHPTRVLKNIVKCVEQTGFTFKVDYYNSETFSNNYTIIDNVVVLGNNYFRSLQKFITSELGYHIKNYEINRELCMKYPNLKLRERIPEEFHITIDEGELRIGNIKLESLRCEINGSKSSRG